MVGATPKSKQLSIFSKMPGSAHLEDPMSRCRRLCVSLVTVCCLLLMLAVIVSPSPAVAQSDSNPKWDLFVGYQWLHPGGNVPTPFGDPGHPTPFKIPDMSKGFGSALTYN